MNAIRRQSNRVGLRKQRGVVLFVALIFLIILTLLGLSNMQVGVMEERMTGSFRDRNNLAYESAELALREGESYLNGVAVGPFNNTKRGLHPAFENGSSSAFWRVRQVSASSPACPGTGTVTTFNWLQTGQTDRCSSIELPADKKLPGTAEVPKYVIEELADVPKPGTTVKAGTALDSTKVFRITARGVGGQATSVVILQSTFKR